MWQTTNHLMICGLTLFPLVQIASVVAWQCGQWGRERFYFSFLFEVSSGNLSPIDAFTK